MDVTKLLLASGIGLLTWNVWTTHNLVRDVAVIRASLSEASHDRYTATQAQLLEQRIESLERQIYDLKKDVD